MLTRGHLALYGCVRWGALLVCLALAGCSSSAHSSAAATPPATSPTSGATATVIVSAPTITVVPSTTALPADVPLPAHATLISENAATINTVSATTWLYAVIGSSPSAIIMFYTSAMPPKGWATIPTPAQAPQSSYTGHVTFQKSITRLCAIGAQADEHTPGVVALLISITH